MLWRTISAAVLSFVLAVNVSAEWANQKNEKPRDTGTRNVHGIVQLPDESPAAGAVVKLKNLKTLQVLSYITQANGKYQFNNLSTGIDYELRAELRNMESNKKSLSVFDNRLEALVNLKLEEKKDKDKDKTED